MNSSEIIQESSTTHLYWTGRATVNSKQAEFYGSLPPATVIDWPWGMASLTIFSLS